MASLRVSTILVALVITSSASAGNPKPCETLLKEPATYSRVWLNRLNDSVSEHSISDKEPMAAFADKGVPLAEAELFPLQPEARLHLTLEGSPLTSARMVFGSGDSRPSILIPLESASDTTTVDYARHLLAADLVFKELFSLARELLPTRAFLLTEGSQGLGVRIRLPKVDSSGRFFESLADAQNALPDFKIDVPEVLHAYRYLIGANASAPAGFLVETVRSNKKANVVAILNTGDSFSSAEATLPPLRNYKPPAGANIDLLTEYLGKFLTPVELSAFSARLAALIGDPKSP